MRTWNIPYVSRHSVLLRGQLYNVQDVDDSGVTLVHEISLDGSPGIALSPRQWSMPRSELCPIGTQKLGEDPQWHGPKMWLGDENDVSTSEDWLLTTR